MKKAVALLLLSLCLALTGCAERYRGYAPLSGLQASEYGSFSAETTYSYDGRYYAEQRIEENENSKWKMVVLHIYRAEDDHEIAFYALERAVDFWGVCWETDSYNIWVQSGDVGCYCLRFEENGGWTRDWNAVMPENIISRYKMRNGSFEYGIVFSADGQFAASKDLSGNIQILPASAVRSAESEDGGGYFIDPAAENITLLPLEEKQAEQYGGLCWEKDANRLWVRFGDEARCIAQVGGVWQWDDGACPPDSVCLAYRYDGSIARRP